MSYSLSHVQFARFQHHGVMKIKVFSLLLFVLSCSSKKHSQQEPNKNIGSSHQTETIAFSHFNNTLNQIAQQKKAFSKESKQVNLHEKINDYWITTISDTLYRYWAGTPWDFNGTANYPQVAPVACGYFVTIILQNMGLKINRVKLSTCASSEMMKALVPDRKIINLTSDSRDQLVKKIKQLQKGVYIIGLSQHTGLVVQDGSHCFFIHSNYIGRKGVMKEDIESSIALHSSTIHWLMPLSTEKDFVQRWLAH